MKRLLVALAAVAAIASAPIVADAMAAGGSATVKVAHTSRGALLANGRGFTLYVFARDRLRHDSCVSIPGCTTIWPPLRTAGGIRAGAGIKRSLLGTIRLPGGARQVTYAGHPLYTYIGDPGPGSTSYIGFNQAGGRWFAISPGGRVIK